MNLGITSDWINGGSYSGTANYVYHLLAELIKLNQENIYLINYEENQLINSCNKIIIYNHFRRFSKTVLWYLYLGKQSNRLKELDIIHNPTQCPTFFRFKQKYVITVFDLTPFICSKEHPAQRVLYNKFFLPRTLKIADRIIAISVSTKKDLINYFNIPEEKIRVTLLAANENFRPLNNEEVSRVKQKYGLDFPFVLYVGTLEPVSYTHLTLPTNREV